MGYGINFFLKFKSIELVKISFLLLVIIVVIVVGIFGPPASLILFSICSILILFLKSSIKVSQMIFFFLLLGLGIGRSAFAHIHIQVGILPLYVTEIVMFILLLGWLIGPSFHGNSSIALTRGLDKFLLAYIILGFIYLIRDIGNYGVEALRDSAIFYYGLFYFLVQLVIKSDDDVRKLSYVLTIVAIFIPANLIYMIILGPQQDYTGILGRRDGLRYISGNHIFANFFPLWIFALLPYIKKFRMLAIFIAIANIVSSIFTFSRASIIGLGTALSFISLTATNRKNTIFIIALSIFTALFFISILVFIYISLPEEFSIFLTHRFSFNSTGRINFWKVGMEKFKSHPVMGIGFGMPIFAGTRLIPSYKVFDEAENLTNLHNSYFTILTRMGILGAILFLGALVSFYYECFNFIRSNADSKYRAYIIAFTGIHITLSITAAFSGALENPQSGIFFWTIMGICTVIRRIWQQESDYQQFVVERR